MPKPGDARRRSAHGPAQRPATRPIPPGRTSSGRVEQQLTAQQPTINRHNSSTTRHNDNVNGPQPARPDFGPSPGNYGPAPAAQMIAPGDAARDAEVNTLSQQFENLPSSLTPAVELSDSETSSSEPGEVVGKQKTSPKQTIPEPLPTAGPSIEAPASPIIDRGEKIRRAAAVEAQRKNEQIEADRNGPLSQQDPALIRQVREEEERRSQGDPLFVRGTTEDHLSDHEIADDEDEPESTPTSPVVANNVLSKKRSSPEPEVSDGAKKQKVFSTDFRIRMYDRLKPQGKLERDSLLQSIRRNWGPRWELDLSQDLWLIDSKTKRPQHPKNWSNPVLERIIELSGLTRKEPGRAAAALREAINQRTSTGHGSRRLERFEDIEIAKQLVVSPPAGQASMVDLLRASASSTATLDHDTPSRRPARRTSGPTSANDSPTLQTAAGAPAPSSPQIKHETDSTPFSPKSPRLNQARKVYTVSELFALDIDTLEKAYHGIVAQWSQVEREMARRRTGNSAFPPLNRELSKLNSEALFQLYQESCEQKLLLGQELQGRTPEVPGADVSVPMVLDG
ncbi:hypothetical protein PRZ48_011543 [Zasmidium cellare]|uniref:Uncharacterized protein n=1 Tax=Zasmidium cellare TaxID=395010 RepID=A0ABR0E761_ZASCE|nr:hypothetical protein PRZ48_011543 [Zasmidium cellare]